MPIGFLLFANPTARVGCNISALSAVDDAWWTPVLDRLAATPELASRLVIEITETAPRGDIDPILGFVRVNSGGTYRYPVNFRFIK